MYLLPQSTSQDRKEETNEQRKKNIGEGARRKKGKKRDGQRSRFQMELSHFLYIFPVC